METDGNHIQQKDYDPLEPICETCLYKDKDIDHLLKEIEQDNRFSLLKVYDSNSDKRFRH
jgi:hypothetical protein